MQLGIENYQYSDSYFAVIHPFTYILIGIFALVSVSVFLILKNKK
jgi:hypothetical protein